MAEKVIISYISIWQGDLSDNISTTHNIPFSFKYIIHVSIQERKKERATLRSSELDPSTRLSFGLKIPEITQSPPVTSSGEV